MKSSNLPDATQNPRFTGHRTFMRLPAASDSGAPDAAVVGIPFDTAASFRTGQRFGPSAVRDISVLLRPSNQFHGVNAFQRLEVIDAGDVPAIPGNIDETYRRIAERFGSLLAQGTVPIGIGGDHSVTLGELRAAAKAHGPVALVQLDAHCDTWDNYWGVRYTHGTPFRRAMEEGLLLKGRSIQVGMRGSEYAPGDLDESRRMGFEVITTPEMLKLKPAEVAAAIKKRVGAAPAFLTFDVDFFDPAYAPGTGTPEVGGPTSAFGLEVVQHLTGLKIAAFDVVEVLPSADSAQITALLAATLVFEFLALIAMDEGRSVVGAKGGGSGVEGPGAGPRGKGSSGQGRQPVQGGGRRRKAVR
ncbi:MAG: agmatinase [Candidatus Dormibacterales bacterium]